MAPMWVLCSRAAHSPRPRHLAQTSQQCRVGQQPPPTTFEMRMQAHLHFKDPWGSLVFIHSTVLCGSPLYRCAAHPTALCGIPPYGGVLPIQQFCEAVHYTAEFFWGGQTNTLGGISSLAANFSTKCNTI